jgi:uncharacterized protein YkwD
MRTARLSILFATIALVAALAACAPFKSGPGAPPLPFGAAQPQAQELYYMVNNDRGFWGLPPVGWNDQLGGLAQGWSESMAGSGSMSHQNLNAILNSPGYEQFSGLGENVIAGGCGISAAQMHQAWMASDLHRANILGNFNAIGIGVACNGSNVYATEDFGR